MRIRTRSTSHRHVGVRRLAAVVTAVLAFASTVSVAAAEPGDEDPPVAHDMATDPVFEARRPLAGGGDTITVSGHGFGHGRGMGQYGALGYAIDHGWTRNQILDHYYGDTDAGTVANDWIGVRLRELDGRSTVVRVPAGRAIAYSVDGVSWTLAPDQAVRVVLQGDVDQYRLETGPSCSGPWTVRATIDLAFVRLFPAIPTGGGGFTLDHSSTNGGGDAESMLQVCEPDGGVTWYRTEVRVARFEDEQRTVSRLPLEQYLRSVVPREMPSSWANLGGGSGAAALQAQAISARSYAMAENRYAYAKTCDTQACQVYEGFQSQAAGASITSNEHSLADAAIAATAGQVRVRGAAVARTEFSSSTGGHTQGYTDTNPGAFTFPAVIDAGDAVEQNPNHNWSTELTVAEIEAEYAGAQLEVVRVVERNGLGADGGRVERVELEFSDKTVTRTGNQFRLDFGLKSDWFSISYRRVPANAHVLFHDISASPYAGSADWPGRVLRLYIATFLRLPDESGWEHWTASGWTLRDMARFFVSSPEFQNRYGDLGPVPFIELVYQNVLGRPPDTDGLIFWFWFLLNPENDRADMMIGFSESVEFLTSTGTR